MDTHRYVKFYQLTDDSWHIKFSLSSHNSPNSRLEIELCLWRNKFSIVKDTIFSLESSNYTFYKQLNKPL